ncbi:MAG: hypothetical protein ACTHOU_06370 [Aureliella sp.]|jgi:hypothetical protein
MQKIKLFKSIESELHSLEDEMNAWIAESGARIISVTGNIAPQTGNTQQAGMFSASDVLVIVLYEVGDV